MPNPNENPNANENPAPNEGGGANPQEDIAKLKEALRKERDAHGETSKKYTAIEKQLADIQNSGKSEAEKLAARLKALEDDNAAKSAAIRERDARDAIRDAATKAGASNADVIYRAVKGDVEYAADGTATNVDTLVKDLKELAPQLFRAATGKADAGAGNGGRPKNFDMNAQIRAMAGRG